MYRSVILVLLIFIAFTVGLGFLMGRFAESKGYGFWNWFFASSLLGIIWLVAVPNLTKDMNITAEEADRKKSSTNVAGVILSVLGQAIALMQLSSALKV
jgi:hypothetical protein